LHFFSPEVHEILPAILHNPGVTPEPPEVSGVLLGLCLGVATGIRAVLAGPELEDLTAEDPLLG